MRACERRRVSLEDWARNLRGLRAARATEIDEDCEAHGVGRRCVGGRDCFALLCLARREAYEPALRMPVVERRRGARLAEDIDGKRREPRARGRAVRDSAAHPREYERT